MAVWEKIPSILSICTNQLWDWFIFLMFLNILRWFFFYLWKIKSAVNKLIFFMEFSRQLRWDMNVDIVVSFIYDLRRRSYLAIENSGYLRMFLRYHFSLSSFNNKNVTLSNQSIIFSLKKTMHQADTWQSGISRELSVILCGKRELSPEVQRVTLFWYREWVWSQIGGNKTMWWKA